MRILFIGMPDIPAVFVNNIKDAIHEINKHPDVLKFPSLLIQSINFDTMIYYID